MGRSHCPRCGGAINTMEAGCAYCGAPIPPDRELHEEDWKRLRVLAEVLDKRIWAETPQIEFRLGLRYWLAVTGLAVLAGAVARLATGILPLAAVAMVLQCGLALLVYYREFRSCLGNRSRETVYLRTVRPALRTVLSAYNIHEAHWQALILQMEEKMEINDLPEMFHQPSIPAEGEEGMDLVLKQLKAQSSEQEYGQYHWNSTLAYLGAGSLVNIVTLALAALFGIGWIPALIILLLLEALVVWWAIDSATPLEGFLAYGPPCATSGRHGTPWLRPGAVKTT